MANVFDVASYILQKMAPKEPGGITTWKLQKLVYYSQAWSLVWADQPLFDEQIEAWANGPVCPDLYSQHRGIFKISELPQGNPGELSNDQKDTIDKVIDHYGKETSQYLSELTHAESPWIEAREGLKAGERSNKPITLDSMALYYGGLYSEDTGATDVVAS